MRISFLTLMLILLSLSISYAQKQSPQASPTPTLSSTPRPSPSPFPTSFEPETHPDGERMMRPNYFGQTDQTSQTNLGWGILLFGAVIIGLEMAVMLRLKKGWGTQSIRIVGLTLVLVSGLFLIVAGYSQDQIAPMIGLLGTITGFLLGKTSSKETD